MPKGKKKIVLEGNPANPITEDNKQEREFDFLRQGSDCDPEMVENNIWCLGAILDERVDVCLSFLVAALLSE